MRRQKLCPRVTDISFVGNLRITLAPMVDRIPGFGECGPARNNYAHERRNVMSCSLLSTSAPTLSSRPSLHTAHTVCTIFALFSSLQPCMCAFSLLRVPRTAVAVTATFRKQPLIKYTLNFGKALGGSVIATPVQMAVDYIVKDQLEKMMVWPQRIVAPMPMMPPKEGDKLVIQRLQLRNKGILRVTVISAKQLVSDDARSRVM